MVNEDDFKRPQVPLKVAKAKLEPHLGTIPVRVGPIRSNSDYKAISVQLQRLENFSNYIEGRQLRINKTKQAGAELCQAQTQLSSSIRLL